MGHEVLQLQNGGDIKIIRLEIKGPLKRLVTDENIFRPLSSIYDDWSLDSERDREIEGLRCEEICRWRHAHVNEVERTTAY